MKKCAKCGQVLPEDNFNKSKASKDGLQYYCKECQKKNASDRYYKAKEIQNEWKSITNDKNKGLAAYTPRQLMEELRRRGYKGTLTYEQKIILEKLC